MKETLKDILLENRRNQKEVWRRDSNASSLKARDRSIGLSILILKCTKFFVK